MQVQQLAEAHGGIALLRIEDTDSSRVRQKFDDMLIEDLTWLGFSWPSLIRRQSQHYVEYWSVLDDLADRGLLYPCSCNRKAIQAAGAKLGSDGLVYPGTCRYRSMIDSKPGDAIRLNVEKALSLISKPLTYKEIGENDGQVNISVDHLLSNLGDPVLRRKETGDPAYHLACVHDDALQSVTHVVRGSDIKGLTPIHIVLQQLMGWPTPTYLHHRLILDADGKRLAKVSLSKSISSYKAEGATPNDIRELVGLPKV